MQGEVSMVVHFTNWGEISTIGAVYGSEVGISLRYSR